MRGIFKTKPTGRPPRYKDIKKAQEMRKRGLSFREISKLLLKRNDPTTIFRWMKYDVSKMAS